MPVKAALVGLSAPHSQGWLQTLRHSPEVGQVLACDGESDAPEGIATFRSPAALLQAGAPDFAIVSLPNDQAPAAAEILLGAGIPCIVEKPAGRTAADLARLNEVAAGAGVPWAAAFVNRLHPVVAELKRLIDGGALGRILSVEGRVVTSTVQQRNPAHWLFSGPRAGGGILHWLGIHTIDLIRYLTGLEYRAVCGMQATLSATGIDVEDVSAHSFSLSNGALGSLHAGYLLTQRYGDFYLCLRGESGEATWQMWGFEGAGHALQVCSNAPGWETAGHRQLSFTPREAPGYGGSMGQLFVRDFIASFRHQSRFITGGEDALKALQFVEAAYRAGASGHTVQLDRQR
ncbi:MAG: Gfo/Idh/MocA family oxidoreductase [Candidatus Handelsmanbacteria bacterium]|nr:Gfo/Idh/MocA family oxidoreductase [Candidatus Handelsmanbacteria bacterium]